MSFPKHLDSSLIDVDVHPTYLSVIVKNKLLRLRLPVEVKADESKCQRSKVTGHLLIAMPIANASKSRIESIFVKTKPTNLSGKAKKTSSLIPGAVGVRIPSGHIVERRTKVKSLAEQMLESAAALSVSDTATSANASTIALASDEKPSIHEVSAADDLD